MTKEYRYQQRLRAIFRCPGCRSRSLRFVYCLRCRQRRRARVNRWNQAKRSGEQRGIAVPRRTEGE